MPTSRIERMVLLVLLSHQFASAATVCQRLPHLKRRSVAGALAFLTADRSVQRVQRGLYCLTEQGRARIEGDPHL